MRMLRASRRIRQQTRSARAKVIIVGRLGGLVHGREIIGHCEPVGGGKLDETIPVVPAIGVGAETSVCGLKIKIVAGIDAESGSSHPEPAFAGVDTKLCRGGIWGGV